MNLNLDIVKVNIGNSVILALSGIAMTFSFILFLISDLENLANEIFIGLTFISFILTINYLKTYKKIGMVQFDESIIVLKYNNDLIKTIIVNKDLRIEYEDIGYRGQDYKITFLGIPMIKRDGIWTVLFDNGTEIQKIKILVIKKKYKKLRSLLQQYEQALK